MKTLLAFLAILLCCSQLEAQNVEGQIVASQFGQFQVPGISTGSLVFEPATCQVSGGGKNFTAFAVGVPVKIVDANPSLNEIDTPTAVFPSQCAISMTTTHLHTVPFYVTSGTGGLQEAITNGPVKGGGPNTIILNADWYTQVLPGNPAAVIAAVKGNTSMGLVDVTTSPYTYYQWNGSQYAAVSASGLPPASAAGQVPTSTGAGTNYVATTSPSLPLASVAGQTIVSSGAGTTYTATTLPTFPASGIVNATSTSTSTAATSTQIATALNISPTTPLVTALIPQATSSAFGTVKPDNSSITISGGVISATPTLLPNASATGQPLVSVAAGNNYVAGTAVTLATGSTGVTQTVGDNTTKVATDAFVLANGGGASTPATADVLKGNGSVNGVVAATPGNDYVYPFAFNGMGSQGIATSSANFGANQFQLNGSCWDGTTHQQDTFAMGSVPGSNGANPVMINLFNHYGGCAGQAIGIFGYPLTFNGEHGAVIDAQYYGAFGDAYAPQDGCRFTASSTTVDCPDDQFVSGDVGKDIWGHGAGAAGVAFHATLITFTDNEHMVMSAAPSTTVTNTPANTVYGHDDAAAIQSCFQQSASQGIQCVLHPSGIAPGPGGIGFLVGSAGLQLVGNNSVLETSATNVSSSSMVQGVNLFCEFNGDCLSIAAGPIQGASVSNIELNEDPTQPASRGINLTATDGSYGTGGLWNSVFNNVTVQNPALECLYSQGGGGASYGFNLPIQIDNFFNLQCNGPNQSHPANLIEMVGQHAQIVFINGQANGSGSHSNYPNALINLQELTSGMGDSPDDVKFIGYTAEVGELGVRFQRGTNLHFDDSYFENLDTAASVVASSGYTFNGDHIANSGGTTASFTIDSGTTGSSGSLRDNWEYGGASVPPHFAVCTGSNGNYVLLSGNGGPNNLTSPSCRPSISISAAGSPFAAGCGSATTITVPNLQTDSHVYLSYPSDPTTLTGWGSTPGMRIVAWPSATNTLSYKLCNDTSSAITYGAITFGVDYQ